jgi:putative acetyltransferase
MSEKWIIRTESNADYDSIDRVIVAASGEPETPELVRNLRSDGDALLSLVAETESHIVGHIMMSRILIENVTAYVDAVALAPLMLDPGYQNQGIGSLLTRDALERCRELGESIILVLGHPTYYPRFGFSADLAQPLQIPFKPTVSGAYMALELKPGALKGISGKVKYGRAFQLPMEWTTQHFAPIVIRQFEDTDEAAVVEVWLRSGKAAYTFLPSWQTLTSASAVIAFRHEIRAKCDVWVAVMNREIVGYLALKGPYIDRLYVEC